MTYQVRLIESATGQVFARVVLVDPDGAEHPSKHRGTLHRTAQGTPVVKPRP
ncbi:hypothetical protein [Synechococcus sp. SYN20]|uniref:hypothetical protein n=1 Tax=Synechococcus sp. SYN20 TaxID=1050714 RepID=UPI001644F8FF|nr:hypothetical protein [Synechococcus sp. SYN20]